MPSWPGPIPRSKRNQLRSCETSSVVPTRTPNPAFLLRYATYATTPMQGRAKVSGGGAWGLRIPTQHATRRHCRHLGADGSAETTNSIELDRDMQAHSLQVWRSVGQTFGFHTLFQWQIPSCQGLREGGEAGQTQRGSLTKPLGDIKLCEVDGKPTTVSPAVLAIYLYGDNIFCKLKSTLYSQCLSATHGH